MATRRARPRPSADVVFYGLLALLGAIVLVRGIVGGPEVEPIVASGDRDRAFRRFGDELVPGVRRPIFIDNGGYFLAEALIYEDGVLDVWGPKVLGDLARDLGTGWVVLGVPAGEEVSLGFLGDVEVDEFVPAGRVDLLEQVAATQRAFGITPSSAASRFDELRPDHPKVFSNWSQDLTFRDEAGETLRGDRILAFVGDEPLRLMDLVVYEDGMVDVGTLVAVDEAIDRIREGRIRSEIPDGARFEIPGLGTIRARTFTPYLAPGELETRLRDRAAELQGGETTESICRRVLREFLDDPTEENRTRLRVAYEAVPSFDRIFLLGDQDAKDGPIRRIVYDGESDPDRLALWRRAYFDDAPGPEAASD